MSNIYAYSLFALPLSFIGIPVYIYLSEFYSVALNLSLVTIGIVILCTRCFDAIADPICGYVSDRLSSYRKQIIFLCSIFIGLSFYLLFNPIFENKAVNLTVFSILTYFFLSILTVNHLSLISVFNDKAKTSSLREVFTVLGLLIATILPSFLISKYSYFVAFKIIGIVVFSLIGLCTIVFIGFVDIKNSHKNSKFSFNSIKNVVLLRYFLFLFCNGMAIATPSVLVIFYTKSYLGLERYLGVFLGTYFLSAIFFMPLWKAICVKFNPSNLFKIGALGSIFTFCFCYFVKNGDFVFYLAICFFSGIFFGVDLMTPTIITNNIIEKYKIEDQKSLIFGLTHFISKASVATVSGFILIILGLKTGDEYIKTIHIFYTILPCILKIISLYIFCNIKNI